MMAKVGYWRVSTTEQDPQPQIEALEAAGCDRIYGDKDSGSKESRPDFDRMMEYVRDGDTIVVVSVDRLTRSFKHVMLLMLTELVPRNITLIILDKGIDTSTEVGQLLITVFGMVGQMERSFNSERTKRKLASAAKSGRKGGRRAALKPAQHKALLAMAETGTLTNRDLAEHFGVSISTVKRSLHDSRSQLDSTTSEHVAVSSSRPPTR